MDARAWRLPEASTADTQPEDVPPPAEITFEVRAWKKLIDMLLRSLVLTGYEPGCKKRKIREAQGSVQKPWGVGCDCSATPE
jgi:hypothetical protein